MIAVLIAAAVGVGAALALNGNGNQGTANAGNTSKAGLTPTSVPSVADTKTGFMSIDALNNPSTALPAGWSRSRR